MRFYLYVCVFHVYDRHSSIQYSPTGKSVQMGHDGLMAVAGSYSSGDVYVFTRDSDNVTHMASNWYLDGVLKFGTHEWGYNPVIAYAVDLSQDGQVVAAGAPSVWSNGSQTGGCRSTT